MKLSVSIPDEQMVLLDRIVEQRGLKSRSAAIQEGIELLLTSSLVADYKAAFEECDRAEGALWETTEGDGLDAETPWW